MRADRARCEEKARKVRCLVLDVDGVLTDGRIILDGGTGEWKAFDVKDGHAVVLARRRGLRVVFLTGRESGVVRRRAAELSVDEVYQGVKDKSAVMEHLFEEAEVAGDEVAYLGDDLPDLPAMKKAGLAGAVGDAVPEVLEAADWVSGRPGGRGAVREMVEFILRAQGSWEQETV